MSLKFGRLKRKWKEFSTWAADCWERLGITSARPKPLSHQIHKLPVEIKEMIILTIDDPIDLSQALQLPELASFECPSYRLIRHARTVVTRADYIRGPYPYKLIDINKQITWCPVRKKAANDLRTTISLWLELRGRIDGLGVQEIDRLTQLQWIPTWRRKHWVR